MPRQKRDASTDAAAEAFRHRLSRHVGPGTSDEAPPGARGEALLTFAEPDSEGPGEESAPPSRIRFRTSRRVALLVAGACLMLLVVLMWQASAERTTSTPLESAGSITDGAGQPVADENAAPTTAPAGGGPKVTVHVAGAVNRPGVVSLPEGSRVFEALAAAGGATPEAATDALNLAELVADGAKITVPVAGAVSHIPESAVGSGSASGGGGSNSDGSGSDGSGASGGKINVNTASVEGLSTLPRVGPVMAQRIVAWRKDHGPFLSVDDLDAVDGIGPKLMESLRPLVTVQGG